MDTTQKTEYRARRDIGLRGQGDKPERVLAPFSEDGYPKQGQHLVRVRGKGGKGFLRVNRKQSRQRSVVRATKPGFLHEVNAPKWQPTIDPNETNHDRVLARAVRRAS